MWKKLWQKFVSFYKKDSTTYTVLILMIVVGSVLRFYNLKDTFMFEGDQGRDALVVMDMLKNKHFVAIGPVTSVGNMYLGPFYYYFMAPWLLLSNYHPLGPVIGVEILSILTILLTYTLGKKIIGKKGALLAAVLITFSHSAINYARFSWNPNITPFFTILIIYFMYMAINKDSRYLIWAGLCCGLIVQLHYVNLVVVGGCGVIWLYSLWSTMWSKKQHRSSSEMSKFWISSLLGLGIFLLSLSTLFAFDIKHGGLNTKALLGIFSNEDSFNGNNLLNTIMVSLAETRGKTAHLLLDLLLPKIELFYAKMVFSFVAIATYLMCTIKEKSRKRKSGLLIVLTFLIVGIVGISFYRSSVFDHYILFALPMAALFFGYILGKLWEVQFGKYLVPIIIMLYIIYNAMNYNFEPQGLPYSKKVSLTQYIIAESENKKYNLVQMPDDGDVYGQKYRYIATTLGEAPVALEEHETAQILWVIDDSAKMTPKEIMDSPLYELVIFGRDNIVDIKRPIENGPVIYKLVK